MKRSFTWRVKLTFFNYSPSLPLCTKTSGLSPQRPSTGIIHWLIMTPDLYSAGVTWHTGLTCILFVRRSSQSDMAFSANGIEPQQHLTGSSTRGNVKWLIVTLFKATVNLGEIRFTGDSLRQTCRLQKKCRTCYLMFWCTRERTPHDNIFF